MKTILFAFLLFCVSCSNVPPDDPTVLSKEENISKEIQSLLWLSKGSDILYKEEISKALAYWGAPSSFYPTAYFPKEKAIIEIRPIDEPALFLEKFGSTLKGETIIIQIYLSNIYRNVPYPNTQKEKFSNMLVSAIAHEIGHAYGLEHSNNPASIMFPVYVDLPVFDASFDRAELHKKKSIYGSEFYPDFGVSCN
jgi:hypothetical protein